MMFDEDQKGATILRDFNIDGQPSSGAYRPPKASMREWMGIVESHVALFAVTQGQFRRAVRSSGTGRLSALRDAIPADVEDNVAIAWADGIVPRTGILANFTKNTLSLSEGEMNSIFAVAAISAI